MSFATISLLQPSERTFLHQGDNAVSAATWCAEVQEIAAQLTNYGSSKRLAVCSREPLELLLVASACLVAGWSFAPLTFRNPKAIRSYQAVQANADYCWPNTAFESSAVVQTIDLNLPQSTAELTATSEQTLASMPAPIVSATPMIAQLTQLASVLMTSGSSGQPKAVLHRLEQHLAAAQFCNPVLALSADSCWLMSLPIFHTAGYSIFIRCLAAGAALALPNNANGDLLEQLQQAPITHCSLVATQLQRLLQHSDFCAQHLKLRHIMLGGGPVPSELIQQACQRGFKIYLSYGMTETAAAIALSEVEDDCGISLTAEAAGEYQNIKLGSDGQILLRGPQVAACYLSENKQTTLIDDSGWFTSGDLGRIHQGKLYVRGRADNRFISGGENIQPEAVEQVLKQHPAVEQVLVVPVRDSEFGQRPVAFVCWQGKPQKPEQMQQWLGVRLAKFMWPIDWLSWPEGQDSVKPNRSQLAALASEILTDSNNAGNRTKH